MESQADNKNMSRNGENTLKIMKKFPLKYECK